MNKIFATLRNLFRRESVERDLDAEVRSYSDLLQEEKMSDGMNSSEAKRAARMNMGGPEQLKEEIRSGRAGALARNALARSEIRRAHAAQKFRRRRHRECSPSLSASAQTPQSSAS